jgi:diguanylate cyclase (GGDEF)-like protein
MGKTEMEKVEYLSEIDNLSKLLIRTLKGFSSNNQPLTPQVLKEMLMEDSKFQEVFSDSKHDLVEGNKKSGREPCFVELKMTYLNILGCFENCTEGFIDRLATLQNDIEAAKEFKELIRLGDSVFRFIKDHENNTAESLVQLSGFITDIGKNLIETEAQVNDSFKRTHQTYQLNNKFSLNLEDQMDDFTKTVQISKDLAKIKKSVLSRLSSIRDAVEEKRKADDLRLAEAKREMQTLRGTLGQMKEEIQEAHRKTKSLERETLLDPLTGVHNRRGYEKRIQEELHRYQRYEQSFSLVLIDIDQFKEVNDRFGHAVGDRCLKETVSTISPVLRESDFLARYGGDEFVIILPGTGKEGARQTAERVRQRIQGTRFVCSSGHKEEHIPITLSLGVTEAQPSDPDADSLFERLDKAMFDAKKSGRNSTAIR